MERVIRGFLAGAEVQVSRENSYERVAELDVQDKVSDLSQSADGREQHHASSR